ncbi:MAG: cytochrome c oxidase subunit I [Deltaproteobacteria bacterium RBG_16_71_12]|nr:MAG: cytochrome c oxidase subunit I [Deltaproteobacteria bacterium RBG_16_71_12]
MTTTTAPTSHAGADDHAADHAPAEHEQSFFMKYLWSTDHKVIGFQYMITGLLMAIIGGYMAYGFRMQLAWPGEWIPGVGFLSSQQYNAYVTTHGTVMIFWFAMPVLIAAFGNWLIPLMTGCDDMAFPRINRLSYQVFFVSALVLLASFFVDGGAFGGAWTAYPPLSAKATMNLTPLGSTLWVVAVALEFVAFLLGGINFITTSMNARAPGMTMMRIPIVVWTIVVASILFMVSVGPLVAGAAMLVLDQQVGTHFYDPGHGGDPILWQHLFWFFGHPEVYVVLLPAMGVCAEIITCNARKKFFGYQTFLYTLFATGIISFFVWAHHQFVAGIDPRMANIFTITTLIISIPIAEMIFLYIATLAGGQIRLNVPMLWALSFLAEFLLGGVTGIFLGASGSDIYFHDTYFVIAHFHYTFVPIAVIACFAGFTHWIPKMTGRMMNETIGKLHFWTTIVGFNLVFLPLFITGMWGDHRRIYNYQHFPDLSTQAMQDLRIASTVGLLIMIAAQGFFVWNLVWTWKKGPPAGNNPWRGTTLEWQTTSPPGHGNFHPMPTVHRGPYEYSVPGAAEDFIPQNQPPA